MFMEVFVVNPSCLFFSSDIIILFTFVLAY